MIDRYTTAAFKDHWSDRNRYRVWLEVELAVCSELYQEGKIPRAIWKTLKSKVEKLLASGGVDPKRVLKIEEVTKHDVIAFTTAVAEKIGPSARYIHYGLTSSDVVDTALSILVVRAGKHLQEAALELRRALIQRARGTRDLATIGRSHGIFAEPTSFGLKFLSFALEVKRCEDRLRLALEGMRTGKLSGAVGASAHFSPSLEEKILKRLGLKRALVSTQVLPRDLHAEFLSALAQMGGAVERIALELRHLQRSEVGEVLEGFSKGQKGSSAMPHKRNPISSENLTGCARLLRSYAGAALENNALWHERDISHSSVERVIIPDATILTHYALTRMTRVVEHLEIKKKRVEENLKRAGTASFSGHFLLALVDRGVTREEAYVWVQSCALQSLDSGSDFVSKIKKHPEIKRRLTSAEIQKLGSMSYQLRNVDLIFKKALIELRGP